tara:strand:- start:14095 stop:14565 length:471 start_codon:yes stop_codon:yes gene_type:complete
MTKKSQVATEFLLITGFFMLIMIPTIFYFYAYTQEATIEVDTSRAASLGDAIVSTAESAYYYGRDTKLTLNIDLPGGVSNMYVECYEAGLPEGQDPRKECALNINMSNNELYFNSDVPIKGEFDENDLLQGMHDVVFVTEKDTLGMYVNIEFKKDE